MISSHADMSDETWVGSNGLIPVSVPENGATKVVVFFSPSSAGTFYLQAVYSGDGNYGGSYSNIAPLTVTGFAAPTVTAVPVRVGCEPVRDDFSFK